MKKRNKNKKQVPAYAFGIKQIGNAMGNYSGVASMVGAGLAGATEEGSAANIAGGALSGAASGASAGMAFGPIGAVAGGVLGLGGSLVKGLFQKKKIEEQKRRREQSERTQLGMNNAANLASEYWDDNEQAYTFENGGILPDLAYLDNDEVVRNDYGDILQVPNTKVGTDNHLVDASSLDAVLSDKIKRSSTGRTFAQEGKKLVSMSKPSKGKDVFAQNTDRLNKINANNAFNNLLEEQEMIKAKKGIRPKTKGIPAYEDGKNGKIKIRAGIWNPEEYEISNPFSNIFDRKGLNTDNASVETNTRAGIYNPEKLKYNPNTAVNAINSLGSPTTGAWFTPTIESKSTNNYVDGITGETIPVFEGIDAGSIEVDDNVTLSPIDIKSKATGNVRRPGPAPVPDMQELVDRDYYGADTPLTASMPKLNAKGKMAKDELSTKLTPIANKVNPNTGKPKSKFNLPDINSSLLELAPTMYNFMQGLRGPETESTVLNPYAGAVNRAMSKRRLNIAPTLAANRRSRAIANYNASNLNTSTGANLATRTQMAASEYANNADLYAARDNANNAYLGEYANMMNNLGQQYVQNQVMTNDLNARNRAAARNYSGTAASQIGQWSQTREQMRNMMNRDEMMLPFLGQYLRAGFANPMVDTFINKANRRYGK